ncbi:MAG: hypothetical protein ACJ8GW_01785 [Massilia sp.]
MNKDDMSDDAEFDAFLKGEDALSRRLQALPAAVPSAALDAAILQQARELMAQDARPVAANDPGPARPVAGLRRLSWRWRVPAGIAATMVTGLFALQTYRQSAQFEPGLALPAEETALILQAPQAPPKVALEEPARDLPAAMNSAPAPAAVAAAPPPPLAEIAAPVPSYPGAPAAPAVEAVAPAPQATSPVARAPSQPLAEARAQIGDRDAYASDMARAQTPESRPRERDTAVLAKPMPAPAMPAPLAAPPAPIVAAPVVASAGRPAASEKADLQSGYAARNESRSAESTAKKIDQLAPPSQWLVTIEALLAGGKDKEALTQWRVFRKAYPDYPVPDTTRERIKAIDQ